MILLHMETIVSPNRVLLRGEATRKPRGLQGTHRAYMGGLAYTWRIWRGFRI